MANEGDMETGTLKKKGLPVAAGGLLLLLLLWVGVAPAEQRLGNLIKLVYVHGALVWVGLATFSVAGVLGLAALLVRRRVWYNGSQAAGLAALVVWIAYVISAILVTGLTWGQWIAWGEPRVQATALILIAALVLAAVTWLVRSRDFTAIVNILLGMATWVVVKQAEVIRHPVDPIGASESEPMRVYYILITLTVAALAATLLGWLWLVLQREAGQQSSGDDY